MLKLTLLTIAATAVLALPAPASAQNDNASAPQLPMPAKSGYAPVNGVEVYYQVYGEGEPLVLLHGGFGAIEMFGPNIAALAASHTVIGVDLQAHGRTLPFDRPMTFENLASDIAGLIHYLGYDKADLVGYSTGGQVALRTAIDHPEVVDRLVVISTPYARSGWHQFNLDGMAQLGEGSAEAMKGTPMYEMFAVVNPDPETNWPKLHIQQGSLVNADYDWSAEVPGIAAPTLVVVGDWDSVRIAHATQFFELLGGGRQDAGWDGSGMNPNRFAVLPSSTHYGIFTDPRLPKTVIPFLDAQ